MGEGGEESCGLGVDRWEWVSVEKERRDERQIVKQVHREGREGERQKDSNRPDVLAHRTRSAVQWVQCEKLHTFIYVFSLFRIYFIFSTLRMCSIWNWIILYWFGGVLVQKSTPVLVPIPETTLSHLSLFLTPVSPCSKKHCKSGLFDASYGRLKKND